MKKGKGSTLFLRGVIGLMALIALAICIFGVPSISSGIMTEYLGLAAYWRYIIVAGLYASAIPFFAALYQTIKLLGYIDANNAFSELSVSALKNIKYSAITMSALLIVSFEPLAFLVADADDAPGLVIIAMAFCCAPIVIAVFAAVLQRLLRNAIDMKSENELTV